jgi:hypothetical protein
LLYPAYNDKCFLEQNIASIINQTYKNWELIVVNDASTDETPEILNKFQSVYPDRIRVFHKNGHDRFDAWDICYAESRGDFLAILGADDVLLPWCVEEQVRTFSENPSAAFVYGDVYRFDDKGQLIAHFASEQPDRPFQISRLLATNYLVTPAVLIKRTAIEAAGGFLNRKFLYSQDYDLWLRLIHGGEQKHVGRTILKYRIHKAQLTVVIGSTKTFKSGAEVIRDKLAKWQPEEVFPGINLESDEGQAAAYQEIRDMMFSAQSALCNVSLDFLAFFSSLIDQPAKGVKARKAKFRLLENAASLFRSRGEYAVATRQFWRALKQGAPLEKDFYKNLLRKVQYRLR